MRNPCRSLLGHGLDEMVDLDEERLRALDVLTRQKERIVKSYNKRVKI